MRRVWPLTPRGTGALVLALACFVVANQLGLVELVWFGVLMLVLAGGSLLAVGFGRGRADVARTAAPAVPTAGAEVEIVVRVTARSALPAMGGRWHDELPSGFEGTASGVFPAIASRFSRGERTAELAYRVTARRRGIHWLGPLQLASTDPFGIARRTVALGEMTRLVVTPAVVELPPLPGLTGRPGGTAAATANRLGQGADDLVARPWAPGDSMRRIHWRASAHRDELMVRQEERETSPEAVIVLDRSAVRWNAAAMQHPGADGRFETAVSLCASALLRLVQDGYVVQLADADGAVLCDRIAAADAGSIEEAMLTLATITARPEDRLPALADALSGVTIGPLIVITGRLTASDAGTLAVVAHHSAHPVLFAAEPEPGALDAAGAWAVGAWDDDPAEAWRRAASTRTGDVPA